MKTELNTKHAESNHSKQVKYAAYLLKLNASSRVGMLAAMKPKLREKMDALILEQKAKNISDWAPQVRTSYLKQLRNNNFTQYQTLLPKVAAYESALAMN